MLTAAINSVDHENIPLGNMGFEKDFRIIKIRNALETHGFDVVYNTMGISMKLDWIGIKDSILEFYILKNSANQIRARLKKKSENMCPNFEDFSFHAETYLEYMRNVLKGSLSGLATVGRFFYYGYRKGVHYYYAHIDMSKEPNELFIRQIFLEKTLEQLKGVDSKIFRSVLDMSGLPRSSIVRLALTRIFRSATDPEELMAVVSREAARIVNAEEWKTVRNLLGSNRIDSMSNMIYILWEEISKSYMKKAWERLHREGPDCIPGL